MYKLLKNPDNSDRTDQILRTADKAVIPNDTQNRDWVEYQAWLNAVDGQGNSLGNTPDAA